LEKHQVTLNVKKCRFLVNFVSYLGFLLDGQGLRADPSRMDELLKKLAPTTFAEPKSFIGMVTFYHKCGQSLSSVLNPLYQLQKQPKWSWGPTEEETFRKARSLISERILVPYSLQRPLRLTADASNVGAGCVIAQVTPDGEEEPIAFASKKFSETELRYPAHEREAAALVFGLQKFKKYLEGREFEICSDNKPLVANSGDKNKERPMAASRL